MMNRPWKRRSDLNDRIPSVQELRRGTPSERGYDAFWNRLAKRRRDADDWLCQPCLREGRITASNEVDHIVPIHVRPDWRLEFDNTQVICRCCHRRKTNEDTKRYGPSEARVITQEQRCAREEALRMVVPPRSANVTGGGEVVSAIDLQAYRGGIDVRASAKLEAGGEAQ